MSTQKSYKTFWDDKASTTKGALLAVDGSANEDVLRLTGAYSARQVTTALDLRPSDRVLELGCGVGRIGHLLAPKVAHWEGADISANMLRVAKERLAAHGNVGFTELTRTSLVPIADASMDKAYCVAVFIHMDKEDFYLYLEELARVVKPGGLVYFDTWNLASPVGWRRYALEVAQYRGADIGTRKDVARNQFSTPDEVRAFLEHAGFEMLLVLSDSPWVQAVARRKGGNGDSGGTRERLQTQAQQIAYTPLWTELFDTLIKVTTEGMPPQTALDMMADGSRGEEVPMFRAWFLELWRANEQHWGKAPNLS
jgi:ubiquinone/menaquinone biosynthesis C-methylase UbiE